MTRTEDAALIDRALELLKSAVESVTVQDWQAAPVNPSVAQIVANTIEGRQVIAERVKTENAPVVALALRSATALIPVLRNARLLADVYPLPESVRHEVAHGVRVAKTVLGEK